MKNYNTKPFEKCECQAAGFCPHRNMQMPQRFWEACGHRTGLTTEQDNYLVREVSKLQEILGNTEQAVETQPQETKEQSKPPSLLKKAANLTKAVAKHAANGFQGASLEVIAERTAICDVCPEKTGRGTCNKCGCKLKFKIAWPTEHCPLGKWPGDTPQQPKEEGKQGKSGCSGCK